MSASLIVPFLAELQARKIKVGLQEAMQLARALRMELHESSLDGFYHVARALCVHREADLDAFDQAFAAHFRGIAAASVDTLAALDDWLKDPRNRRELSEAERAELASIDMEELRKLFEERLKEQKERHDGGNRWIGTGGTSPFGAHGAHPSGVRVGPNGGGRSAMAVADARLYKGYRSDLVLDVRQIEVALRKLRALERTGAADELDLDETIAETAKNAGELEIVVRPPKRPNVRILLLMDVGGSMDPYAELVSRLFSAAKRASNLREVKTYYFHNCIYGHLYPTGDFQSEPVKLEEIFEGTTPEWRLVMVGDAAMHPAELTGQGDWVYYAREGRGGERTSASGLDWMMRVAEHYKKVAWLNPEPPQYWRSGTAEVLARVFPMYQLTLDGLGDAVAHLAGKKAETNDERGLIRYARGAVSQSPSTISSIAEASYAQIVALRESMRRHVQSQPSLEEASQAFVQKLYDELGGSAALVRMYVTLPATRLPPAERKFAEAVCASKSLRLEPSARVLTLLGTYGNEMAWCDRTRSVGHLAIPLIDASFVEGLPMIARLLAELGVDIAHIDDDAVFARRLIGGFIGVFHVAEAADAVDSRGRRIIPATDFVKAHGIRTVFGMGGAFLDGNIASCIVFARETFSRTQAERFASLISNFKLLTGPLLREGHFFRAPK